MGEEITMKESEETTYGVEDDEEKRIQSFGERRPRKGVAEGYFETEEGKSSVRVYDTTGSHDAQDAFEAALDAKHVLVIGGTGSGICK